MIELVAISLLFLFIGLTLGFATSRVNKLAVLGIGFFVGSLVWLGSLLFSASLVALPLFVDYVLTLNSFLAAPFILNNQILTAVFALIVLLELGYVIGYATASRAAAAVAISTPAKPRISTSATSKNTPQLESGLPASSKAPALARTLDGVALVRESSEAVKDPHATVSPYILRTVSPRTIGPGLSEDEKTLASLFILGRVGEIVPKLDDSTPEGYYYEQLRYLDWDLARKTMALNSLAVRGYLVASPKEKVLRCKQCDSMRLQLRSECPDCGSLRTQRYKVLEHFPCGMIDKEENFKRDNGELMCPKCNKRLDLIGIDYRSLGSMFACSDCGALNKDLSTTVKCTKCGHVARPDEESEDYLFSYSLNTAMIPKLRQYVKPVQTIANYLEGLGFTVFSPAQIKGKSGTEHTVDILALERKKPLSSLGEPKLVDSSSSPRKLIIDILVSESQVKLEDITRIYGKISDVSGESLVIAIPSLTENAKNYADKYRLNVVEAETAIAAISRIEKTLGLETRANNQVSSI